MERYEAAKQEALKQQKDQELESYGFKKVGDGVSFPGINVTEVNMALMKRAEIKLHEILKPTVKFKLMSVYGKVIISFSHVILLPGEISNTLWDKIFDLQV